MLSTINNHYLYIGLDIYRILFNGFVFNFTFPADCSQVPQKASFTGGVATGESDWILQNTGTEHTAPGVRAAAHFPRLLAVVL